MVIGGCNRRLAETPSQDSENGGGVSSLDRFSRLGERRQMVMHCLGLAWEDSGWRRSLGKALERADYYLVHPEIDGGRLPNFEPYAVRNGRAVQADFFREMGAEPGERVNGEVNWLPEGRSFWLRYSAPRSRGPNKTGRYFFDVYDAQFDQGWGFVLLCGAHDHAFFIPANDMASMVGRNYISDHYHLNLAANDEDPSSSSRRYVLHAGRDRVFDVTDYWLRYDLLTHEPFYVRPWRFLFEDEPWDYSEPYHCELCGSELVPPNEPIPWAYAVYDATTPDNVVGLLCPQCRREFGRMRGLSSQFRH